MANIAEYDSKKQPNSWGGIYDNDSTYVYPNIQSCIAIAIVHSMGNKMIGVHLTTGSKGNELVQVVQKIKDNLKARHALAYGVYIAGGYSQHWGNSALKVELQKITSKIYLCDVPVLKPSNSANCDVKFVSNGTTIAGSIKPNDNKITAFTPIAFKLM